MQSIGIDSIEIARFKTWNTYPLKKLQRLFAPQEIAYCMANRLKSAERFAAHFAAKEALFKAIGSIVVFPFLTICKKSMLSRKHNGQPFLKLEKDFQELLGKTRIHVSITHTKSTATAIVLL